MPKTATKKSKATKSPSQPRKCGNTGPKKYSGDWQPVNRRGPCFGYPPVFVSDEDAIAWSIGQGAFQSLAEAQQAFDALAAQYLKPYHWPMWLRLVGRRLLAKGVSW